MDSSILIQKIDDYILIVCESDELYESGKLFNFWSSKYLNEEKGKRDFKVTCRLFMTLVKRNKFFYNPKGMLLNTFKQKKTCT